MSSSLHKKAAAAQKNAHAPYSKFHVGAAVTSGSHVFSGCNVENASYGGTVCAERVAIWSAVAAGHTKIDEIVVVSDSKKPAPPCGFCLQVMAEFCSKNTKVHLASSKKIIETFQLKDLLPHPFGPDFL